MKDWKGNSKSVFAQLGVSNHSTEERQNEDYYATDPEAAQWLLRIEDIPKDKPIWECAAGARHLADVFECAAEVTWPCDRHAPSSVATSWLAQATR